MKRLTLAKEKRYGSKLSFIMAAKVFSVFMRTRVIAASMILIVASAFSTIASKDIPTKLPFKLLGIEPSHPDQSLEYFVNARAMKPFLPPRGVVGYVTDVATCPYSFCSIIHQHGLAPLLIKSGTSYPYVVGYLPSQAGRARATQEHDLETVRDFGGGYVILRKRH